MTTFFMSGCGIFGPAPGKGRKAKRGYAKAAPVIKAIDEYHNETGGYPSSLDVLLPTYLAEWPKGFDADGICLGFIPEDGLCYTKTEKSYEIRFSYTGPGKNICVYTPESGWNAIGYF